MEHFSGNGGGTAGNGEGQFNLPVSLIIHHGRAYITDMYNNRVQVFFLNGTYISHWDTGKVLGEVSTGPDSLFLPFSICVNSSGYFYVGGDGGIKVYSPQMNYVTSIGSFGNGDDQMQIASGLAFNSTGYLFSADAGNNRIHVISPDNEFVTRFGEMGSEPGQFLIPIGLAIDKEDRIFVTDAQNYRIQVFDPVGAFIAEWGSQGSNPGQFDGITTIAIIYSGKGSKTMQELIYINDLFNDRIQVFAACPPVAEFSGSPRTGPAPLQVLLADTSSGDLTEWLWDFGDGNSSIAQNPIHTYLQKGKYTVTLTVSNSAGGNSVTKKNYIVVTARSANSCGTVYIGQTYDISKCVASGDAVGWWASSTDKYTSSPNLMLGIASPESFYADPAFFSGFTGIWYIVDPSTGYAGAEAFTIENPKVK